MPLHIWVVRYEAASLAHLSQQERKVQRRCRCPPRFPGGSTTSARGVVFDHNDEALLLRSTGAAGFRQGPLPTKRPAIPHVLNSPGNWRFLQHIIILSSNSLFASHGPCTPYRNRTIDVVDNIGLITISYGRVWFACVSHFRKSQIKIIG